MVTQITKGIKISSYAWGFKFIANSKIVVIVVVALIVFGPVGLGKKLGNLVKGTGQGVKEFKKALEEGKEDEEKKED